MHKVFGRNTERYLLLFVCLLCGYGVARIAWAERSTAPFHDAVVAFEDRRFPECVQRCERMLAENPEFHEARLLKAQALGALHEWGTALPEFERIPKNKPGLRALAEFGIGEHYFLKSQDEPAEEHLRACLELDPRHRTANRRMMFLTQIQARTWESLPYVMELVRQGDFKADELVMLGTPHALWLRDPDRMDNILVRSKPNSMYLFGPLRSAILQNKQQDVLTPLQRIIEANPHQAEPLILLGDIRFRSGDEAAFTNWIRKHEKVLQHHPHFWYLCGLWAQTRDPELAARCQLKAQSLTPRHPASAFQLSQSQTGLPQEISERLSQHAIASSELEFLLFELRAELDINMIKKTVPILMGQGRFWEAAAWAELLLRFYPEETWAREALFESRAQLTSDDFDLQAGAPARALIKAGLKPAALTDLEPLRDGSLMSASAKRPQQSETTSEHVISFRELGREAGIDFQYFNGTTPELGLVHILQATGGAVVVLDYDLDGWPDLYFAQSGVWPVEESTNPHRDRLFRNLGNETFVDVTASAGLGDGYFSQGATVGDFDNDGDPDLFLTNVGPNRLYWNNGDGTFSTREMSDFGEAPVWSMSTAAADINRDGLLDLYVVNYLELQPVLDRACKTDGKPRGCSPTMFDAEQDRVWLNLGDGTFRDVTETHGFVDAGGKGLGVVAADFDNDSETEIFVGNDTVANFYFEPSGSNNDRENPRFQNVGLLKGVALDAGGRAQASMGIASGDLNSDGTLDLFITNFYADANTLYAGLDSQFFRDDTRAANLFDSGYHLLGFGTQAFDIERDGDLDLVLLNGHIDRTFATGEPDLMPPQVLVNENGRFQERSGESLGTYFQDRYFGRSMSTIDVNRDGQSDLAVTHLESASRVLLNTTQPEHGFLKVYLVGTRSPRWPVGARLKLIIDGVAQSRWVTSGDGYLSSNEHVVTFSIPEQDAPSAILEIHWPSGVTQQVQGVPANRELVVVENNDVETKTSILPH